MSTEILCPVSFGELLDKISILRVKRMRISDPDKVAEAEKEHDALVEVLNAQPNRPRNEEWIGELAVINRELWDVLQAQREAVDSMEFMYAAKMVVDLNDRRFDVKKRINEESGSTLKEVKHYE